VVKKEADAPLSEMSGLARDLDRANIKSEAPSDQPPCSAFVATMVAPISSGPMRSGDMKYFSYARGYGADHYNDALKEGPSGVEKMVEEVAEQLKYLDHGSPDSIPPSIKFEGRVYTFPKGQKAIPIGAYVEDPSVGIPFGPWEPNKGVSRLSCVLVAPDDNCSFLVVVGGAMGVKTIDQTIEPGYVGIVRIERGVMQEFTCGEKTIIINPSQ
jgi:hypothetical protein